MVKHADRWGNEHGAADTAEAVAAIARIAGNNSRISSSAIRFLKHALQSDALEGWVEHSTELFDTL